MNTIGLRKEEKPFETRVPVVPDHLKRLSETHQIRFVVEPSDQRAFGPEEFTDVGAEMKSLKGNNIPVILGIKEMPVDFFEKDTVYVFFSHTIKGQKYNMPMLQRILDVGATLMDYERVIDEKGRRLIFFGNWAGIAGVSDTLRILGERLDYRSVKPNPFAGMKHTLQCKTLAELKDEFRALGDRISEQGLPNHLVPFVVGFTGYGNVSRGAQEMFDLLPHVKIEPEKIFGISEPKDNILYKCIFKEEHMVEPKDSAADFNLQDYYKSGSATYRGVFEKYVPHLVLILNCIYWSDKYPRLVTKNFIKNHWHSENRKLEVVGDISCDVEGAIQFTVQTTNPGNPAFTYIVDKDRAELGIKGDGPVVMAVDNLPCELPRESSTSFSETLLDYIPALANADFTVPFQELNLPIELKDAVIVYQGELTNNYAYLKKYL